MLSVARNLGRGRVISWKHKILIEYAGCSYKRLDGSSQDWDYEFQVQWAILQSESLNKSSFRNNKISSILKEYLTEFRSQNRYQKQRQQVLMVE